jgi:hypothetical protein
MDAADINGHELHLLADMGPLRRKADKPHQTPMINNVGGAGFLLSALMESASWRLEFNNCVGTIWQCLRSVYRPSLCALRFFQDTALCAIAQLRVRQDRITEGSEIMTLVER